MSKKYINSKKISELIDEANVRDRFKATVTLIEFGSGEAAEYISTNITAIDADKMFERDHDFIHAVCKYLIEHKDFDKTIEIDDDHFLYISGDEAIAESIAKRDHDKQLTFQIYYEFEPRWRLALAGYLFEHHNEDKVYAEHKDFLTNNKYFEEYDANINEIHEEVKREMDYDNITEEPETPSTGIKATKTFGV